MKVAVIGASGRTGSLIVLYSLQRGDEVAALVRDAQKLEGLLEGRASAGDLSRLTVVEGQSTSSEDVERAVQGADVIYETVGPYFNTPGMKLKQDTALAIITAMKKCGVRRLVSLGSSGPAHLPPLLRRVHDFMLDQVEHDLVAARALLLAQSPQLDVTVVRPPFLLLTAEPTRQYKISDHSLLRPGKMNLVPIPDLALSMIDIANQAPPVKADVWVSCTADYSLLKPLPGAYRPGQLLFLDNLRRKLLPKLLITSGAVVVLAVVLRRYMS